MNKIAVLLTEPIEYNTSSMIRTRNVINGLARIGNTIECLSPYPDKSNMYFSKTFHLEKLISLKRYGEKKYSNNVTNHIKTNHGGTTNGIMHHLYCILKKIDLFGSSIRYIVWAKEIYSQIKDFDYLITFSDPKTSHIIGGYCKIKKSGFIYIQQWGDPLSNDITDSTCLPRWFKQMIEYLLLKKADRIYYVSPLTLITQKKSFPSLARKMFFSPTPCEIKIYGEENRNKMCIGYVGSYKSIARNIVPLYDATDQFPQIDFEFVGDTDLQLRKKSNLNIIDRVPHDKLDGLMRKYDVLVCIMNKKGNQIPGKIYNYAGTDKEVLIIKDGENAAEIQSYFEKFHRYSFADNTVESIVDIINKYLIFGIPIRKPLDKFFPESVAKMLLGI